MVQKIKGQYMKGSTLQTIYYMNGSILFKGQVYEWGRFREIRDIASKFLGLLPDPITWIRVLLCYKQLCYGGFRQPIFFAGPDVGSMLSEYRNLVYADDRYKDNILSFAYLCQSFLRLSREKNVKCLLSKNLHQNVPNPQNESCLACK